METLRSWLTRTDVKEMQALPPAELYTTRFNRDPNRSILADSSLLYAPADGFLLYSKVVKPDADIMHVKGAQFTVNDAFHLQLKCPCLIIGTFLTVLDVHINRMPSNGFLTYQPLEAVVPDNLKMDPVEQDILAGLKIDPNELEYDAVNQRMVCRVYNPDLQHAYYLLQVADFAVDTIAQMHAQNALLRQGQRFAAIKFGSQVDLMIPLDGSVKAVSLVDQHLGMHVEAAVDPLVRWKKAE